MDEVNIDPAANWKPVEKPKDCNDDEGVCVCVCVCVWGGGGERERGFL